MGTQGAGRKRLPNRERLTAEDDALNQIAREVSVGPVRYAGVAAAAVRRRSVCPPAGAWAGTRAPGEALGRPGAGPPSPGRAGDTDLTPVPGSLRPLPPSALGSGAPPLTQGGPGR